MNIEMNQSDSAEKCKLDNSQKIKFMYIFLNSFE